MVDCVIPPPLFGNERRRKSCLFAPFTHPKTLDFWFCGSAVLSIRTMACLPPPIKLMIPNNVGPAMIFIHSQSEFEHMEWPSGPVKSSFRGKVVLRFYGKMEKMNGETY